MREALAAMCIESSVGTRRLAMRTNIEIDDDLIREALRISGLRTKRAAVEAGLKALIRLNRQKKILDLAGKVQWEDNLDESREGRRELPTSAPPRDHDPKTIDLLIGTFCIERGHTLLHSDRDFSPMESFLGLQTA